MATKFGIRNYSRSGNNIQFTLVALNANGTVDTGFTGTVDWDMANSPNVNGLSSYTFTPANAGSRTFQVTVINAANPVQITGSLRGDFGFSAALIVSGPGGLFSGSFGSGDNIYVGGPGFDGFFGNDGNDLFLLQQGNTDGATGGAGDDGFYFGAAYTSADTVDGGAGTLDQLALQGNYSAGVTLGQIIEVEMLVLLPGSDARFGDTANNFYDYSIIAPDASVAAGQRLIVQANSLRSGEDLAFNGAAETDGWFLFYGGRGVDTLTGGAGNDGFFFGDGRFGASDVVNGGGGTADQIGFQGNFTVSFGAGQLTGIEFLVLLSASDSRFGASGGTVGYTLTMHNANVIAGQQLIVSANTLQEGETLVFRGFDETDGTFRIFSGAGDDILVGGQASGDIIFGGAGNDIIEGQGGGDQLTGGAGEDSFAYFKVADSTSGTPDSILDFTLGDKIDLETLSANNGFGTFTFIGGNAQSGARQVQVLQNGGTATVNIFMDADNVADMAISVVVADQHILTVADFAGTVSPTGNVMPVAAGPDGDFGRSGVLPDERGIRWHDVRFDHFDLAISSTHDLLV